MTKFTTQVPNIVFDRFLPLLSESELKVLLVIVRQTYGWHKERDWVSHSQFMLKTGLSKRSITNAIHSLSSKGIILVTDLSGKPRIHSNERKGSKRLFYSFQTRPLMKEGAICANSCYLPFQNVHLTEETLTKEDHTEERL